MQPRWTWSTLPPGFAIALLAAAIAAVALLPQAVALAFLSPHSFSGDSKLSLLGVFGLWGQPDPSLVTGATASGAVHWLIVAGILALIVGAGVTIAVVLVRRAKDPQRLEGLASMSDVSKELGTKQLVTQRAPKLRPSLHGTRVNPHDVGYRVGTFHDEALWIRAEDPTIVIGPSRSGKGWYLVLNWILSAPGALITTSSKMDNAQLTLRARQRRGSRPWIFAPGIAGGEDLGHVLRWDPIDGCIDEETLVRRIKALIPSDAFSGSTSNGGHWDTLGQQLASHLFHAAACKGVDVDTIWEWVGNPQRALDAVRAIREHPEGLLEHANHLESVINTPPEQRASTWGTLPTVLAFLESRTARVWMKPGEDDSFDPVQFILNKETLFLVGDKQTTGGFVRIIDGLLAELDYVSKGLADASPGSRLDPHVSYILDEAGNFEYQGLYEIITAGGGRGRVVVAVFQSKDQLAQWGQDNAGTLWDAAVAKIILPGGSSPKDLDEFSKLVGELWVTRESRSWGAGPSSVQVSEERRAILEGADIRTMRTGYALMFYRHLKPLIPKLTPFSEHAEFARCQADADELASKMRKQSPFAQAISEHQGQRA